MNGPTVTAPGAPARTDSRAERQSAPALEPAAGRRRLFVPSLVDLTFMLWAVVIPFALHRRISSGDGDPARHVRLGEWMLARAAHELMSR